eukprot:COSAG03_NODE_711_length_6158_cov_95.789734_5_plen_173_part_00
MLIKMDELPGKNDLRDRFLIQAAWKDDPAEEVTAFWKRGPKKEELFQKKFSSELFLPGETEEDCSVTPLDAIKAAETKAKNAEKAKAKQAKIEAERAEKEKAKALKQAEIEAEEAATRARSPSSAGPSLAMQLSLPDFGLLTSDPIQCLSGYSTPLTTKLTATPLKGLTTDR